MLVSSLLFGIIILSGTDCKPVCVCVCWLPQRRPAHGTRMRWRDHVRKDLKKFNIGERRWYQLAQDRSGWLEEKLQDRTRGCD